MSIPLLKRLSIGRIIPNEAIYMKKAATFMRAFDLQISWQGCLRQNSLLMLYGTNES